MRVLVLTNMWPSEDRPERGIFVARQVDGVRRLGVGADVIAIDGARSRLEYLRAAWRMFTLNFGRARYDLIHAHTGHCGLVACAQLRYPVLFSYVGYDLDGPAEDWEGVRTKIERTIFRYLSIFVAGTIAKSARGRRRVPMLGRSRSTLLPNGVDRELFAPTPRAEARRRLGWNEEASVVLFAGDRSRFTKRFELTTAAVEAAQKRLPRLELVVGESVPPDQMPVWMNAADVLILTSVSEGSPNVVKEAMACNLPVVSVDVGDVRDVIEGTRHCHVCAAEPDALASALVEVVSALPERSDGRDRTEHLGLANVSRQLHQTYERVSGRGPGLLGFLPRRRRPPAHSPQREGA